MSDRGGLGGGVDELQKSLIASARIDARPAPDAVKNRILAAVTTAGAIGASSATAGALAATSTAGRLVIVKWLAATAMVGAAGFGTYEATRPTRFTVNESARTPNSSEAPAARPVEGEERDPRALSLPVTREPTLVKAPMPERRRTGASRPAAAAESEEPRSASTSLQAEVSLLDRARAAVASDHPASALEILEGYQQAFPRGNLRPEATYLRIQALHKSGQRAAARDLATRFLADHPDTPHAAQVRPLTNP